LPFVIKTEKAYRLTGEIALASLTADHPAALGAKWRLRNEAGSDTRSPLDACAKQER
jgi:hypothetical protein